MSAIINIIRKCYDLKKKTTHTHKMPTLSLTQIGVHFSLTELGTRKNSGCGALIAGRLCILAKFLPIVFFFLILLKI